MTMDTALHWPEKKDLLGVPISATTYHEAVEAIIAAAKLRRPALVSAYAVHAVVTAARDPSSRANGGAPGMRSTTMACPLASEITTMWLTSGSILGLSIPVAIAIAILLVIVTISYRQTIFAYPNGGGAYIVARDNLGELMAQVAGAALLHHKRRRHITQGLADARTGLRQHHARLALALARLEGKGGLRRELRLGGPRLIEAMVGQQLPQPRARAIGIDGL